MPRIIDWYSVWERLKRAGYQKLFEFQEKAIAAFIKGQDVLVKAPTGAGKTLIPLICATFMLGIKQRCVFLVPTRRLIDQTYNRLVAWFDSLARYRRKYRIIKVTGEERPPHRIIKKAEIIVTTFESFNGMLMRNYEYSLLRKLGLVVIDEMHYVGKMQRGSRLEDVIVKTQSWLRPRPQMLYLTAMVKYIGEVSDWLGAEIIETDERHSEIVIEPVIKISDDDEQMSVIARLVKVTYKLEASTQLTDKRCVLVFCASRKKAEIRTAELSRIFEEEGCDITVSFSHAGLSALERQRRMTAFQEGKINVLFTTEYKEGISAPVLRVIIADADAMIYSPQDLESMVGRTARPEFYEIGFANLIVKRDIETFYSEKRIKVTEKGIEFEEERLRSCSKHYMKDIILHRVSRGAASIGVLIRHLQRFYMYYEHRSLIRKYTEVIKTELYRHQSFKVSKRNSKTLLSLLNDNDNYNSLEIKQYKKFVSGFLDCVYDHILKHNEDSIKLRRPILFFLDLLQEHMIQELERYEKQLKNEVKLHLRELISYELVERKGGKYKATTIGRWASQFLLPAIVGNNIRSYFQEQRFSMNETAYWAITDIIAENVYHINGKYSIKHYTYFIKTLVEDYELETAANQVNIWLGDAEESRRTATWIAEAVHAFVTMENPLLVDAAKHICESLTEKSELERGSKVRFYPQKKPSPHKTIQDVICSTLASGTITNYNDLHKRISAHYDHPVGFTTVIWNVLDLDVQGKVVRFSRGKGVGRPEKRICSKETEIPEYMLKTCGSCVFRMPYSYEYEKEREDQRFLCELSAEYNNLMGHHAMITDVTLCTSACKYYDSSRKRKSRTFREFELTIMGTPICRICKKAAIKEPTSYAQYTLCPKCNSLYFLLHNGRIKVEPGTKDLLQEALETILQRSIKPVKVVKQIEGELQRQYIWLTVREGDVLTINRHMLTYISKDGFTRSHRLDAIERIKIIGEVNLSEFVRTKLKGRIVYGEERDDSSRVPFKGCKVSQDENLAEKLKERAEVIREKDDGLLLAWQLDISKRASNALLTLQAEKEGLLEPADANRLFAGQMNVVAHTVIHWTGSRENLLSYEAHGERLAWQVWKLILKETAMKCRSRTYDRFVASSLFMGEAKGRSPFSAGINALKRKLLKKCQKVLWDVGFSWFPGELVLHYRRAVGQKISIGAVLDFREMFLPMFRYAYVKACKKGEITKDDFKLSYTPRGEEVYTLKESAEEKIWLLFQELMDEVVYYDHNYMKLREAMNRCASYLAGFLLNKTPFIPFVYVSDEGQFQELFELFRSIERFCKSIGKGPPVPMTRLSM